MKTQRVLLILVIITFAALVAWMTTRESYTATGDLQLSFKVSNAQAAASWQMEVLAFDAKGNNTSAIQIQQDPSQMLPHTLTVPQGGKITIWQPGTDQKLTRTYTYDELVGLKSTSFTIDKLLLPSLI